MRSAISSGTRDIPDPVENVTECLIWRAAHSSISGHKGEPLLQRMKMRALPPTRGASGRNLLAAVELGQNPLTRTSASPLLPSPRPDGEKVPRRGG